MSNPGQEISAMLRQGMEYMNNHQFHEAKEVFSRACEAHPGDAEAWHQLSIIHWQLGDVETAAECCRRILDLDPEHSGALINLGNIFSSRGEYEAAAEQHQRALQLDSNDYRAGCSLANALQAMGRLDEAMSYLQAAIQSNPNLPLAYLILGHIRIEQEDYQKAWNNFARAAQLNPADPLAQNGVGTALVKQGRNEEALACFREAVRLKPDYAEAVINMCDVLCVLGRDDEAQQAYLQAINVSPAIPEFHNNLGNLYLNQGWVSDAVDSYQKALEINPEYVVALNNLGGACRVLRQLPVYSAYIERYRRTKALVPDATEARNAFFENIVDLVVTGYDQWLDNELREYCATEDANLAPIARLTAVHLLYKYGVNQEAIIDDGALQGALVQASGDPLLRTFLEKAINCKPNMEIFLTNVRSLLLAKHCRTGGMAPAELRLACAIACQCHNNEYVFSVRDDETALVADLKAAIERRAPQMQTPDADLEHNLIAFSMYEGLCALSCREQLNAMPRTAWSEGFQLLVQESLANPLQEQLIKQEIETIGGIEDDTSRLVQSHYEENPYPRWISLPSPARRKDIRQSLKEMFPHFTPPDFAEGPIATLVAGCGTGQHPIISSLTFDNLDILAVDISKSSLAYATRMARKHDIDNVRFMQGDILELSRLHRRFHIVECIGTLVCMKDPLEGWKALTDVLERDGLMLIGLYSEKARQHIVAARQAIAEERLGSTAHDIRDFRRRIVRKEMGDVLYRLTSSRDFYSTSGCRDLIFHSTEHRFTLPQIKGLLDELGLEFIGFEFQDNGVKTHYRNMFPEDNDMTDLLLWDKYEERFPTSFGKLYTFWCRRKV